MFGVDSQQQYAHVLPVPGLPSYSPLMSSGPRKRGRPPGSRNKAKNGKVATGRAAFEAKIDSHHSSATEGGDSPSRLIFHPKDQQLLPFEVESLASRIISQGACGHPGKNYAGASALQEAVQTALEFLAQPWTSVRPSSSASGLRSHDELISPFSSAQGTVFEKVKRQPNPALPSMADKMNELDQASMQGHVIRWCIRCLHYHTYSPSHSFETELCDLTVRTLT